MFKAFIWLHKNKSVYVGVIKKRAYHSPQKNYSAVQTTFKETIKDRELFLNKKTCAAVATPHWQLSIKWTNEQLC